MPSPIRPPVPVLSLALALLAGCGASAHEPSDGAAPDAPGASDGGIEPAGDGAPRDRVVDVPAPAPGDGSASGCRWTGAGATGPRVVLGTGINEFQPVPESGGELELDEGSQGGWHIYGAVELHELAIDGLPLSYRVRDAESGETLTLANRVLLNERRALRDGDHWVRPGDRLIFDIVDPAEVVGRLVEVTATVDPPDTEPLCDRRVVTVVDDE